MAKPPPVRFVVGLSALGVSLAVLGALGAGTGIQGADHKDAPLAAEQAAADIADIYAFASPERAGNVALVMTVNPLSVPGSAAYRFSPYVLYQFHLDVTDDLQDDLTLSFSFGPASAGQPQSYTVNGLGAPIVGLTTPPSVGKTPNTPRIDGRSGIRVFVGQRDDPFFADIVGLMRYLGGPFTPANGLRGAGDAPRDSFAGANVSAIVIELPPPHPPMVKAWASTMQGPVTSNPWLLDQWNRWQAERMARNLDANDWEAFRLHLRGLRAPDPGEWPVALTQVDRMAIPAINGVLIASAQKDAFNQGMPADDVANYRAAVAARISALRGAVRPVLPAEDAPGVPADALASVLIPDVVTVDGSKPIQFPNGRRLTDDVVDAALGLVLNRGNVLGGGPGVSDGIDGNDVPFLTTFPYLAPPHQPQ
ncbi:MAG: DUF4331 family protein [Chloroflexi bacterium]|nr:DUF4331 family protein [Chloroflexota bacterium]